MRLMHDPTPSRAPGRWGSSSRAPDARIGSPAAVVLRWLGLVSLLLLARPAQAHGGAGGPADELTQLVSSGAYAAVWAAYGLGAHRRRLPALRRLAFHAGMALGAWALWGPLDVASAFSTAAHMTQHMLLIGAVAPLLVLGTPLPAWHAVAGRAIDTPARWFVRASRHPMACALVHGMAIWFWHVPGPYELALAHEGWHWLEHASFVATALPFWHGVLRGGRRTAMPAAAALLATLMHTGALGALLTFARAPLYAAPGRDLADQQLAGLVMWVPGGAVYLIAISALVARAWLRDAPFDHPVPAEDRR